MKCMDFFLYTASNGAFGVLPLAWCVWDERILHHYHLLLMQQAESTMIIGQCRSCSQTIQLRERMDLGGRWSELHTCTVQGVLHIVMVYGEQ